MLNSILIDEIYLIYRFYHSISVLAPELTLRRLGSHGRVEELKLLNPVA
jgi:hypothetical protein